MSFNTAISGLNAAQNMLSVTGNNVANANTTGFKKSRSEFADVYNDSVGGVSSSTPGAGVKVARDAQLFQQGNLDYTENSLDLAISGSGFFVMGDSPTDINTRFYTRAGAFNVNQDGYVVNSQNQPLLTYPPNGDKVSAGFSTGIFQPLKLDSTQSNPKASSQVAMSFNLNSKDNKSQAPSPDPVTGVTPPTPADATLLTATFDPADATSYNWSNSATVFDSLGNAHTVSSYFVKTGDNDPLTNNPIWQMHVYLDGTSSDSNMMGSAVAAGTLSGSTGSTANPADPTAAATDPMTISFDSNGRIATLNGVTTPLTFKTNYFSLPKTAPMQLTFDLNKSTQIASDYSTNSLTQDGLPIGNLTGVNVDASGVIFARYSNGASIPMGQAAMARFQNQGGLSKIGNTEWAETIQSGQPLYGVAGTSSFGSITSGALENSNVDIAIQLVNLIIAQQAYQANAQSITTENTLTQAILNIR